MSEHNDRKRRNRRKANKKTSVNKSIKITLLVLLILIVMAGGTLAGIVLSMVKAAPEIDPSQINLDLSHTSSILDLEGNLIEKIETAEFRTFVSINRMPKHLKQAFIAIEDERFFDHRGVDPKGIVSSALENLKADGIVRGASTITQQLVKNVYLTPEKKWSRKVQEAYLALQVDRALSKEQILEAYLNRNFFGQNAYGVQEAAQTYFSKDVEELTLAESALLAGVVKSTQQFQPYYRVRPEEFDPEKHYEVGETNVLGEKYILVFNERSEERQKVVLRKMLDLGMITEAQYEEAKNEDIKSHLKPGQKKTADITSYFADFVKTEVMDALVEKLGYTKEEAEEELFTGGLQIYSTIDVELQKDLEYTYEKFSEILVGNTDRVRGPILIKWSQDRAGNLLDDNKRIIYYRKDNLLDEDYNLIIENGTYKLHENGDLTIKNKKLDIYPKHIDIADYYTIDEGKNLVTHDVGSIVIPEGEFHVGEDGELTIKKAFLDKSEDFYNFDDNNNLLINERYFSISKEGVRQPQSANVIMDYRTGHIKAIIGGRDADGSRVLNRAAHARRQPGSAIKPISVYLPALDNGYTAATTIDDLPYYNEKGELKPRNWYSGYKGIQTLRRSVEQSINVNSVKTVEGIGFKTSMAYLEKMGIINKDNPEKDNFVTREEDNVRNDENTAALALGGMTKGLTPLELTAAFGAIANDGVFVEPIAFTKVLDRNGNLLIDNVPKETTVVSPQVAYIMKDILRSTVTNGLSSRARIANMAVAGKTGTTQDRADIWFVGFTPHYVSGLWIGNDSPLISLNRDSTTAAMYWQYIMNRIHKDLEKIPNFDRPDGLTSANICTQSGLLATPLCKKDPRGVIRSEIFAPGTAPKSHCDVHVEVAICKVTGKVATEFCPEDEVEMKVFVKRTPPYDPSENNNIKPDDYGYQVPTKECDIHDESSLPPEEDDSKDEDEQNGNGGENGENGNGEGQDSNDKNGDNGDKNNQDNNGQTNGNGPVEGEPGNKD